jgi:hypothetical protein
MIRISVVCAAYGGFSRETVAGDGYMTLVMAFIGKAGAVMAGDMREITFLGERGSIERLEEELYEGNIATDDDLEKRAKELGVDLRIRDDKVKVTEDRGVLTGEVTSFEGGVLRRRRMYASAGSYAILDIEGPTATLRGRGGAGNFVVFGNERTKEIANRCIREGWRGGSIRDALGIILRSMELASRTSASVSRKFMILQTREKVDTAKVMEWEETGRI